MIHMKLVVPTGDPRQPIMFECQEPNCGDIVMPNRLNTHAQQSHHSTEVVVDASYGQFERSHERKNPMCPECGHSMWFHNLRGHCSKCSVHDID